MRKILVLVVLGISLSVGCSGTKVRPSNILVEREKSASAVLLKEGEQVVRVKLLSSEEREELLKGIEELKRDGIKVGVERVEVVIFFDPLSSCYREFVRKGELEKFRGRAVFIPISVHGRARTILAAYLLKKAKREPLPLVVEKWFKEEVEVCKKNLEECIKENERLLSRGDLYELEKAKKLFRRLCLRSVPCFINLKTGEVTTLYF